MNYRITDDPQELPVEAVARLLGSTYWAANRPLAQIEESMRNSDCYGVYLDGEEQLAGFARVITDHATTYYLCDVVVDARYRGQGLGSALLDYIESRPEYARLLGLLLTRDAHGFYQKFGYEGANQRAMVKSPRG